MKKNIVLLLLVLLVLLVLGITVYSQLSSQGENSNIADTNDETKPAEDKNDDSGKTEPTPTESDEEWGVKSGFVATYNSKLEKFYLAMPKYPPRSVSTGWAGGQDDGTLVVVDCYLEGSSPEVDGVEQVFPAYFEQTIGVMEIHFGSRYSEGKLSIESQEMITINGYQMCKYVGRHTFEFKFEDMNRQFVAYSAQLKNNGAYIYFLVEDESEDQSLMATIEDHAYRIALSLSEE